MSEKEKRGLFQAIFGKLRPKLDQGSHSQYRLLSSWDSAFSKFSGDAWDISTVRAAADAFCRNAATVLPQHIRRVAGSRAEVEGGLNKLLQFKPNPFMSAFAFYYRIAAQYCVDNNAFILPVFSDSGELTALYPINASRIELVEDDNGEMLARLVYPTGSTWLCHYSQIIHIRRHYKDHDIFGDSNKALLPVLDTADSFNQSMEKFAKLVAVIRGVFKSLQPIKDEDLAARREKFIRENMHMDKNGAGIIVTDTKNEYIPINQREIPIPVGQLEYVRREIYDYIGVNDAIVQNRADQDVMDAFYRGALKPFFVQLAQSLTIGLFSDRELSFGNEIICELDRLQFATLSSRVSAAQFLSSIGAASLDQILDIFGMPPIGGEEGARRVQTLNMVNADIADLYQLLRVGETQNVNDSEGDGGDDPPKKEEDS